MSTRGELMRITEAIEFLNKHESHGGCSEFAFDLTADEEELKQAADLVVGHVGRIERVLRQADEEDALEEEAS